MFLSEKLPLKTVTKQMVAEGVKNIILLEKYFEKVNKICVQIVFPNGSVQG